MNYADAIALLKGEGGLSVGLIALGALIICVVMLRARSRARRQRSNGAQDTSFRRASAYQGNSSPQSSMEELIGDLQDYSRETLAKLDTKARVLSKLIIDADQRIGRLESLTGSSQSRSQATTAQPGLSSGEPKVSEDVQVSLQLSAPQAPADEHAGSAKPPEKLEPARDVGQPKPLGLHGEDDQKREKIWTMGGKGMTPAQIAADLNLPRGEVELLLAMRSKAREERKNG